MTGNNPICPACGAIFELDSDHYGATVIRWASGKFVVATVSLCAACSKHANAGDATGQAAIRKLLECANGEVA